MSGFSSRLFFGFWTRCCLGIVGHYGGLRFSANTKRFSCSFFIHQLLLEVILSRWRSSLWSSRGFIRKEREKKLIQRIKCRLNIRAGLKRYNATGYDPWFFMLLCSATEVRAANSIKCKNYSSRRLVQSISFASMLHVFMCPTVVLHTAIESPDGALTALFIRWLRAAASAFHLIVLPKIAIENIHRTKSTDSLKLAVGKSHW